MKAMNVLGAVDSVTGFRKSVARVADVLGADAPAAPTTQLVPVADAPVVSRASAAAFLAKMGNVPRDVPDGLQTLAGAAAGAFLWKEHRILGAIGGASLGRNIPALFVGAQRGAALRNLSTTAGGIIGSLLIPVHPALGFAAGLVAVGLVHHFGGGK